MYKYTFIFYVLYGENKNGRKVGEVKEFVDQLVVTWKNRYKSNLLLLPKVMKNNGLVSTDYPS